MLVSYRLQEFVERHITTGTGDRLTLAGVTVEGQKLVLVSARCSRGK